MENAGKLACLTAQDLDILLRPHVIGCCALREAKQKVDLAFDQGQKMPCPPGP